MNNFISFNDFQKSTQIKKEPKLNKSLSLQLDYKVQDKFELNDKFEEAKRKNGIIEKIADKIKGAIGIGYSSKKIQSKIANNVNQNEINKDIKNYRRQQENTAQTVGDIASGLAAMGVFFKLKQNYQLLASKFITFNKGMIGDLVSKLDGSKLKDLCEKFLPKSDKKSTAIIIGMIGAAFVGNLVKSMILKINRIGSKEFKLDKEKAEKLDKNEQKQLKKELRKSKRNTDFRNKISGAINGLTAPIIAVGGPVGAVAYVLINSLSRYFIASKADKGEKSLKSYVENLKNSPITNIVSSLVLLIPALKAGKADKIFNQNLEKVVEKLKNANLEDVYSYEKTYDTLEGILLGDDKLKAIIDNQDMPISEKIQKLSDENIFALKFKQIRSNADELSKALKTDCPPTRTVDEANEIVRKTFGADYTIKKCVGVGTVAESYIATDKNGKEVCIKMLKNGISAEKITKDKEAFIQLIRNASDKTPEEKDFLIKNLENIADGVIKEVDLTNEMKAAQALKEVTTKAKVVVPIEVKDNLYVMEKADGISLQELMKRVADNESLEFELKMTKIDVEDYTKRLEEAKKAGDEISAKYCAEQLEFYKKELERLKTAIHGTDEIGAISKDEAKQLLRKYNDVLIEQFSKVDENGKIIHGDIHPGNIFIDIPAMRRGEKDFFTLIDTGNTINQTSESAIRFLNLSKYIQNADVDNIVNFVLEGAVLPAGMDKQQAFEKVSAELKKAFFDDKTKLNIVTNDSILDITSAVMQKLNIIPSDVQGNLMKAKVSATQSLMEFTKTFYEALFKQLDEKAGDKNDIISGMGAIYGMMKEVGQITTEQAFKTKLQERLNLSKMSPALKMKLLKNSTAPAKNSEEYLNYAIKQYLGISDFKKLIEQQTPKGLM